MSSSTKRAADPDEDSLSKERIVSLAKHLMETSGLESVTMRRLAEELRVTPMALYHHVPNKQALLDMLSDAVVGTVAYPGPDAGPWYERIRQGVLTVYQEIARFPGLGQHIWASAEYTPSGVRKMQSAITILTEAGFDAEEALAGLYLLATYMGGDFVVKGGAQRDHARPIFSLDEHGELSLLPSANSKTLINSNQAFLRGLDTIIAGLRAQLAAKQALIPANR